MGRREIGEIKTLMRNGIDEQTPWTALDIFHKNGRGGGSLKHEIPCSTVIGYNFIIGKKDLGVNK